MPDGRRIYVDEVSGGGVAGTANPPVLAPTGGPSASVGVSTYTGSVADFAEYELVGPRFTATFDAPAFGDHPTQDPVLAAMLEVGDVERRSMPPDRATGSPPEVVQGAVTYELTVVALTVEEVRERVVSAVAPFQELAPSAIDVRDAPLRPAK